MFSVSYLIDGSNFNQNDLDACINYTEKCQEDCGIVVEFLIYGKQFKHLRSSSKYVQVISCPTKRVALYIALASASSVWVVITNIKNALNDKNFSIPSLLTTQKTGHVIMPVKHYRFIKRTGIMLNSTVPFIAISKAFFTEAIDDNDVNLRRIINLANEKGYLELAYIPEINHAESVIRKPVIFRLKNKHKNHKKTPRTTKYQSTNNPQEKLRFKNTIPVFIICRDRVKPLRLLVKWLEDEGMVNIFLINNGSTYPPLLQYFKQSPHYVINLQLINAGHVVVWTQGILNIFARNVPYIVTDPDIIPIKSASGAIPYFVEVLNKYPNVLKVGFGLKIDDLPQHYEPRKNVIEWEKKFWSKPVEKDLYDADIDTTFALYRPGTPYVLGPSLRTGGRYMARHEPWYTDSHNVSEELKYYREHADKEIGSWGTNKRDTSRTYGVEQVFGEG